VSEPCFRFSPDPKNPKQCLRCGLEHEPKKEWDLATLVEAGIDLTVLFRPHYLGSDS
jgi:hypothetical protein